MNTENKGNKESAKVKAEKAIAIVVQQLQELENMCKEPEESVGGFDKNDYDYLKECLKRWKDRTAALLSKHINQREGLKFARKRVRMQYGRNKKKIFRDAVKGYWDYLMALKVELETHPEHLLHVSKKETFKPEQEESDNRVKEIKWYRNPYIVVPSVAIILASIIGGIFIIIASFSNRPSFVPITLPEDTLVIQTEVYDTNGVYQDDKIVGHVSGEVKEVAGKFIFSEISNTPNLKRELPFEYRKEKFSIIDYESSVGLLIDMKPNRTETKLDVITNVVCEKIEQ